MHAHRFSQIAQTLKERIISNPDLVLPSIPVLAKEQGASPRTVWRALHQLETEGLVVCRRGRSAQVAPYVREQAGLSPDSGSSAAHRFSRTIKDGIAQGHYTVGDSLPKHDYFSLTYNVSRRVIVDSLRMLEQQGIVHKKGKRWIVGPQESSVANAIGLPDGKPTVLILVSEDNDIRKVFKNIHVLPFSFEFEHETSKAGVVLTTVKQEPSDAGAAVLVGGIEEIVSYAYHLGPHYLGTLVMHCGTNTVQDLDSIVPSLCRLGKPVVYFDSSNEGEECSRKELGGSSCYYRCFFDEYTMVQRALERLWKAGHRCIVVPNHMPPESIWANRRIETIRECIRKEYPGMRMIETHAREQFWSWMREDSEQIDQFLMKRVAHALSLDITSTSVVTSLPGRLLSRTPSLVEPFKQEATAIVALNDSAALEFFTWARAVRLSIPRYLSLVSFDNSPFFSSLPISTVDIGFRQLGYLAAHLFIGDIPVRVDRNGDLPCNPRLSDRGSIGPPSGAHLLNTLT